MHTRLQEIIRYKTGGKKIPFAELMGWTPQYLSKLLKGDNFGIQPVLRIIETLPEINVRWLLTGEGSMTTDNHVSELRLKALATAASLVSLERLIPVMSGEELRQLEQTLSGDNAVFSPDTLSWLTARADEREKEINAKFAAEAKSD